MFPVAFMLLIGKAPAAGPLIESVREVEADCSLEVASALRLKIDLDQTVIGDWGLLQYDVFRPLVPIDLRIQAGGPVPQAVVNGFASAQRVTYSEQPGQTFLEVTALDITTVMNMHEKVMPWPNMPDAAIAAAIFGQYAVVPRTQPTPPTLIEPEGTTTQRGTDIRFLRRLARRNGFDCYVQPEPLTGLDQGFFEPRRPTPGPPQAVLNVGPGEASNVRSFGVRYEMLKPTTAVAATLDPATKAPQPALAPAALQMPMGIEPTGLRVAPPAIVRPADTGAARTSELQPNVQGIVDRSSWAVVAEGEVGSDVGVLRPGGIVNVRGAGRVFNGSYYLTRVRHSISRERYVQRFEAQRNAVTMTGAELYLDI